MRMIKNKKKYILMAILFIFVSMCLFLFIQVNASHKLDGIKNFPDSYKPYLEELAKKHPNWKFTALYTNLDWNYVISQENVFGKNLEQLLMQPPIVGQTVLGWDPAFRTGCKLAVVDPTGKVIGTTVIYPTAPTTPQKIEASKDLLKKIIPKYNITLISVGNGTASRESEQFIVELLKEIPQKVLVIANVVAALVFSLGHIPATIGIFGMLTPFIVIRCFVLNGVAELLTTTAM